jgi:hypothetical protein
MALHEALGIFDGATCFFAGFDESPEQVAIEGVLLGFGDSSGDVI